MTNFNITTINTAKNIVKPNLQSVVDGLANSTEIQQIATEAFIDKYVLMRYVSYVMLGLLPFRMLVDELVDELEIEEEEAQTVVKNVRRLIFAPVIQDIVTLQERAESNYEKLAIKE